MNYGLLACCVLLAGCSIGSIGSMGSAGNMSPSAAANGSSAMSPAYRSQALFERQPPADYRFAPDKKTFTELAISNYGSSGSGEVELFNDKYVQFGIIIQGLDENDGDWFDAKGNLTSPTWPVRSRNTSPLK